MLYRFDNIELDTSRLSVKRDGIKISSEPRVFDLLVHLIENRNQILLKDQLLDSVWQGRIVADTTIATAVKEARKLIGDSGDKQRYIETIRGKGFRFNAPENFSAIDAHTTEFGSVDRQRAAKKTQGFTEPSLLLLPFEISAQEKTMLPMLSKLELSLSRVLLRIPLLKQISVASFSQNDLTDLSARSAYERFDIRYLIKGIAVENQNTTSLNLQLIDNKSGFQLWSYSFNLRNQDQDEREVLSEIIAQLEPQLNQAIYQDLAANEGDKNANALYLQASGLLATKGWYESTFIEATNLLKASIKKNPDFALAYAYLSLLLAFGHRIGLMSDREKVKAESIEMGELAMELDPNDSIALGFVGCAYCDLKLTKRGMPLLEKALHINPDNAQAMVARGAVKLSIGSFEESIADLKKGVDLSPLDARLAVWQSLLSTALLAHGDIDGALTQASEASLRSHNAYMPFVALAAAQLVAKDLTSATSSLAEAFYIKPDLSEKQIAALIGSKLASELIKLDTNPL